MKKNNIRLNKKFNQFEWKKNRLIVYILQKISLVADRNGGCYKKRSYY